ncbi:MAG: M56 family metallopeptidase [Bacteroidaceae bacterium]|nr:M56 family metallopeptidase [Bacteroidaceae bacterium]
MTAIFSPLLELVCRFILVTGLLMLLYWIVWRKQATYKAKRMYLLTMPFVALIIACLRFTYTPEPIVVKVDTPVAVQTEAGVYESSTTNTAAVTETTAATTAQNSVSESRLADFDIWKFLPFAYIVVLLVLSIPLVVNIVKMRKIRKSASVAKEEPNNVTIYTDESIDAPFSFYRSIYMPNSLTEIQARMILIHEKAHIKHRHYIDVWIAETITRILFWNPFIWWARAELRNVHEFEADSDVLSNGEDVYKYQTILIEEVLNGDVVIANGFNHSFIRRRFIEMLQSSNKRMSIKAKIGATAYLMAVTALLCCNVAKAETIYVYEPSEESATFAEATPSLQEIGATAEEPVPSLEEPTLPEEPIAVNDTTGMYISVQNGDVEIINLDTAIGPVEMAGLIKKIFEGAFSAITGTGNVILDIANLAANANYDTTMSQMENLSDQMGLLAEVLEGSMGGMNVDTTVTVANGKVEYKYSVQVAKDEEVVSADDDPYKEFVSPQWGFKCPEGYIRLTEYEELTKTDKNAAKQYTLLVNTMQAAKQLRNKEFENAFKKSKIALYSDIDANINKAIEKLFQNAGIKMLEKGAYRLPDGTIVIEDDKHTMIPQFITYQNNAQSQAPTMLRDKSPNYSAFNEQTWPMYTDFETISDYEYYNEGRRLPEVYRGDGCTYVLLFNDINFYDHWFYTSSETALVSKKGTKTTHFYISSAEHLPLDTYYWIHNQVGKKVCRVQVFPPLPENVRKVDYVYGDIPQEIRLSNAGPIKGLKNLDVKPMPKNMLSRY